MTPDDPARVVREQTIPALRASGGDCHADALGALLNELERQENSLISRDDRIRDLEGEIDRLRARADGWLEQCKKERLHAERLVARLEASYGTLPPDSPFGSVLRIVREALRP